MAVLAYQLVKDQKVWFFVVEIAIIGSLILSYRLYQALIRPLQFLSSGVDAIRDKDFNVKFVKTGSREMDKLIHVYNDMIDNIREERIQAQEQHFFLNKLIQASPAGIVILDFDGNIADANPKAIELLHLPQDHLNYPLSAFKNPILEEIRNMEVNTSKILSDEGFEKYKCQVSDFIHKGFHRKFILIQELSREILEAEKRAYGKIIRMMAHEVNNSIGAINSILNSIADFFKEDYPDWTEPLDIAIERNNSMNTFMSNFAKVVRLPQPHREPTDLNALLMRMGRLFSAQAQNRRIKINLLLADKPVMVSIDSQQIEQVLVNVIKNALESIEEDGLIELNTALSPPSFSVCDNGPGIAPEHVDELFSPFFSTKKNGQGVGLMLSREILMNHNAAFHLKTDENGWTEFWVSFGNK
jgi:nitrogen fixation/metabolism regulation signal transduction histidine kinase